MPPLSDYLDNPDRSGLSEKEQTFLDALPPLEYEDGTAFDGLPKTVIFTDPVQFYDEAGRRLIINSRLQNDNKRLNEFSLIEPERE